MSALGNRIVNSGRYEPGGAFVAQALTADTLEAATATDELTDTDDVMGRRLKWLGCTFSDSDPELDSRVPFFAVVDAIDSDGGIRIRFTCGGERVIATLVRACEMGWFPFDASLEEVKLSGAKRALNIVPWPKKVENTAT